jgi:hypothetical protein
MPNVATRYLQKTGDVSFAKKSKNRNFSNLLRGGVYLEGDMQVPLHPRRAKMRKSITRNRHDVA